jgi:hypothetical protein
VSVPAAAMEASRNTVAEGNALFTFTAQEVGTLLWEVMSYPVPDRLQWTRSEGVSGGCGPVTGPPQQQHA